MGMILMGPGTLLPYIDKGKRLWRQTNGFGKTALEAVSFVYAQILFAANPLIGAAETDLIQGTARTSGQHHPIESQFRNRGLYDFGCVGFT